MTQFWEKLFSSSGLASIYKKKDKENICKNNFPANEKSKNSTITKLEAKRLSLNSSGNKFENKTIFWYADNYACSSFIRKGSNKVALETQNTSYMHKIDLNVCWIPRDKNKEAVKIK